MTRLPDPFVEDRALRDAARAVLADDIARLRTTLSEQGVASRVSSSASATISRRIRSGASDLLDQARTQVGDHKGVLALLIGAILLWFVRGPILDWLEARDDGEPDPQAPGPELEIPAPTDPAVSDGDPA